MTLLEQVRARIAELNQQRAAKDAERSQALVAASAIVQGVEARGDSELTDDERRSFDEHRAKANTVKGELAELDTQLQDQRARELELLEVEEARAAAATVAVKPPADGPGGPAVVRKEERVYAAHPGQYIQDLVRTQYRLEGFEASQDRLNRHGREVQVEARAVGRTTDAELGFFVPPLYAIDDFAAIIRAGRPFADALGPRPLPAGIDSVRVPRFTTGTKVRKQAGDKAAVTTQDVVSAETSADLVTMAGYIDVAVQAIDQSPVDTQEILFQDLGQDYAFQVDTLLLSGAGPASNEPLGALTLGGTTTVTWTDSSPTPGEFYRQIGAAISAVNTNRKLPPEVIVMTPARWWWLVSSLDAQGRPFPGFSNSAPANVGVLSNRLAPEGVVGSILGIPVIIDSNLPTNLGVGTNQDTVIVARISDARLWEGTPHMAARPVVDASAENLLVRLVYYRYGIFLPGRYPTSWAKIDGTGLVTPVFS